MPTTTYRNTESVDVAPASALEEELLRLAAASYRDTLSSLSGLPSSLSFAGAATPTLDPQLQALLAQQQQLTSGIAERSVASTFQGLQRGINADFANRGALNSSANMASQTYMAQRLAEQQAGIADQARAQAAGQMFQGAFQQQGNAIQLLGMIQNLRLAGQNPQLLRDLMNFRMATATRTQTGRTNQPYDPTALVASAGQAVGTYYGYKAG